MVHRLVSYKIIGHALTTVFLSLHKLSFMRTLPRSTNQTKTVTLGGAFMVHNLKLGLTIIDPCINKEKKGTQEKQTSIESVKIRHFYAR